MSDLNNRVQHGKNPHTVTGDKNKIPLFCSKHHMRSNQCCYIPVGDDGTLTFKGIKYTRQPDGRLHKNGGNFFTK